MSATQINTMHVNIKQQKQKRGHTLRSDLSEWFDSDSSSTSDQHDDNDDDDGESDSTSGESSDSISTPESSPPPNRHAVLHEGDAPGTAFGAFDSDGNWYWSKRRVQDEPQQEVDAVRPVLNRHDRTQMVMTGSVGKSSSRPMRAGDVFWTGVIDEDNDDRVPYTSYTARRPSDEEGHVVLPVTLRLEDDSSSDDSESSIVTTSSASSSDSEARRRASLHMMQRLNRVSIPPRRTSVLGHGSAPRRPPSLDEISNRVVSSYRSTSPTTAQPMQQRAVSCPSPLLQFFGDVQVMVTPPTPQLPTGKIPGVVLKSPHSPHTPSYTFATDARGNLAAPAFDVAPGRQIMIAEREQAAKAWLEGFKRQQLNLNLGAGQAVPPMRTADQAEGKFAKNEREELESRTSLSGSPLIPPRRRSFGRRVSGQLQLEADTAAERGAQTESSSQDSRGSVKPAVPNRRSLVARLSLGKSGKRVSDGQGASLLAPRKVVTAAQG